MSFFKKNKKTIDILFWVLIVGVIIYKFGYQSMAPSVAFSELVLVDEKGNDYSLQKFKNKNILINFYQSWCGSCIGEMPDLSEAYKKLQADDFIFIAVSDESFNTINRVKRNGNNQMLFLQSKSSFNEIGIRAYPTTYLLNKKGAVVFETVGAKNWNTSEMLDKFRNLTK